MARLSTKQLLGIILIVAAAIQYVPVVNRVSWLGVVATFVVGIFLLIK
jgi:hypothetical protein